MTEKSFDEALIEKFASAKDDKGKLKLSLVPTQIIRDIAQVREYGCEKYHDPDNWKQVEMQRHTALQALCLQPFVYL